MTATLMTLPIPELEQVPVEAQHSTVLGSTRFWCIQDDCDTEHHVWCSCTDATAHAG